MYVVIGYVSVKNRMKICKSPTGRDQQKSIIIIQKMVLAENNAIKNKVFYYDFNLWWKQKQGVNNKFIFHLLFCIHIY